MREFIQFAPGRRHELRTGARVRPVEMILTTETVGGWFAKPVRGTQTFFLEPDVIESYQPAPEPLKVGDVVSHPDWVPGYTAEIAAIRGGLAAFWKFNVCGGVYGVTPNPRLLSELTKV